jgi:2-oxoglutarate ferredoxin oxidoreductase subunit beta
MEQELTPAELETMERVYARTDLLTDTRFHYCPGCGHGVVHRVLMEVVDELGIQEQTIGVAPVGCSVFAYNYLNVDMQEAAHGRASAVATGIKRILPDKYVFSYQGDGDLAAIGTAETIHTANRGENILVVFINNAIYGMTGGQMAPTTLLGMKTSTSKWPTSWRHFPGPTLSPGMRCTRPMPCDTSRRRSPKPSSIRRRKRGPASSRSSRIVLQDGK